MVVTVARRRLGMLGREREGECAECGVAVVFFFQAEDGIRDLTVTGVQTCALPISNHHLVVAKGARGGIATSDVQVVTGEARTRELARMLGDPDMRTALSHAAELLRKASVSPAAPADRSSPPGRAQRR